MADTITGFFENGGTRCYIVRADFNQNPEDALKQALKDLEPLNDLDLVAIPDAMTLTESDAIIRVQQEALSHCAILGDRIAILDARRSDMGDIKTQGAQLTANQQEPLNGLLYFPWLKNVQGRLVPPCGHIAGIIARSDRTRGVFKAPANEEIFDALDLDVTVDKTLQDELNPLGINCLRAFPGRGIRVWGARTLSQDVNWRYINVRAQRTNYFTKCKAIKSAIICRDRQTRNANKHFRTKFRAIKSAIICRDRQTRNANKHFRTKFRAINSTIICRDRQTRNANKHFRFFPLR